MSTLIISAFVFFAGFTTLCTFVAGLEEGVGFAFVGALVVALMFAIGGSCSYAIAERIIPTGAESPASDEQRESREKI